MKKTLRKNYLLPVEMVSKLRSMVKSGRYVTETEVIRKSLRHLMDMETKRAGEIARELDELAVETAKYLPRRKSAGELVHEAHLEESHSA